MNIWQCRIFPFNPVRMKYWKVRIWAAANRLVCVCVCVGWLSAAAQNEISIWYRHWKGDTHTHNGFQVYALSMAESMFSWLSIVSASVLLRFIITAYLSLWFTSNYAKIATILKYWINSIAVARSLYNSLLCMVCIWFAPTVSGNEFWAVSFGILLSASLSRQISR